MNVLLITICVVVGLLLLLITLLSHRKKSRLSSLHFPGASGVANSPLCPEGTVLIGGELWRARSTDYSSIELASHIKVVGSQEHLLIVEKR